MSEQSPPPEQPVSAKPFPWPTAAAVTFAVATVLGAFIGGFTMGKDVNAGELKDARAAARREFARAEALASKLQAAKAQLTELSSDRSGSTVFGDGCVVSIFRQQNPFGVINPSVTRTRTCVAEGQTVDLYGGNLAISVVVVAMNGSPPRERVTGVIGGQLRSSVRFRNADVGATFAYGRYRIRIDAVATYSASFTVRRLPR